MEENNTEENKIKVKLYILIIFVLIVSLLIAINTTREEKRENINEVNNVKQNLTVENIISEEITLEKKITRIDFKEWLDRM